MLRLISIAFLLLLGISCNSGPDEKAEKPPESEPEALRTPCPAAAQLLPNNQFYEKELGRLVRILPAGDPEVHRRVQVLATPACRLLLDSLIGSAEAYDYQLAHITYNLSSKLIAIKGKLAVHCVDLAENALLPPLVPEFPDERIAVDAQSGQIVRLEVWENFLIGYARDYGAFVFDMQDLQRPRPVLPYAEYAAGDARFASLFLLPSASGVYQALVPVYRASGDHFDINPVFAEPEALLGPSRSASMRRGRKVALRKADGSTVELDLASYLEQ